MQFVEEYTPHDTLTYSIAATAYYTLYINQLSSLLNIY